MTRITYAAYAFRPGASEEDQLECALQIATLNCAIRVSSFFHGEMMAYEYIDDCVHAAPDAPGEVFEDFRDMPFVDMPSDDRYDAFRLALDAWEAQHYDNLCHLSPIGTFCPECAGRTDDVEPAACDRVPAARDARDEFWDRMSMLAEANLPATLPMAA